MQYLLYPLSCASQSQKRQSFPFACPLPPGEGWVEGGFARTAPCTGILARPRRPPPSPGGPDNLLSGCRRHKRPSVNPPNRNTHRPALFIVPGRTPRPLTRIFDQPGSSRIQMHVLDLLANLLLRMKIEVIVLPLPERITLRNLSGICRAGFFPQCPLGANRGLLFPLFH